MVIIKVVAMFDDRTLLDRAREAVIGAGLATEETTWTESDFSGEETEPEAEQPGLWERMKEMFGSDEEHDLSAYAEGLRRGSALLVVETPTEDAEKVKDVLRRSGAIDLRRRVRRWITTGWQTFDPGAPSFTELEILDERRACVSEVDIAADAGSGDDPDRVVSLFNEETGEWVGRISDAELDVLRDALEEEGPDDDDYWINQQEIETISGRPGATPHLIAVLRRALGSKPDGVELRFKRTHEEPGEPT